MIGFQHQLRFINTGQQAEPSAKGDLPAIEIIESDQCLEPHPSCANWYPMSGRQARFTTRDSSLEFHPGWEFGLEVGDVISLRWLRDTHQIVYTRGAAYSPELLRFWVLHTFLPAVLTLENRMEIVHAACVEVEGQAVIFSAPSYGGKSTLTNFFLENGHRLLGDDSLGVDQRDGKFSAIPSYPFYRPWREVETLGLKTNRLMDAPCPIKAVFFLERASPDSKPMTKPVYGVDAFTRVYDARFIRFPSLAKRRLAFFGDLAAQTSMYTLDVPWEQDQLLEVYQKVLSVLKTDSSR